ncbi:MAG: hypothetical protein WA740_03415 [Candidatus Binataceae bacterium]
MLLACARRWRRFDPGFVGVGRILGYLLTLQGPCFSSALTKVALNFGASRSRIRMVVLSGPVVAVVMLYYSKAVLPEQWATDMAAKKRRPIRAIASSRLTSKSQATFPAAVRRCLHLKPGDTVIFEEQEAGTVRIRKAEPLDLEFLEALEGTLSEWSSDNDERAYRDL